MRLNRANERRGIILMVVLSLLTLFAIVGISFVLYADAEAASARIAREGETQQRADVPPEQALAFFLGQLIYDVPDATGYSSGLRGHSLARTMYGYNSAAANLNAFNGVGRLHYQGALNQDDYTLVNYTWFSKDGFIRFPERYNATPGNNPANALNYPYIGGNAPYTYPDLNSFFLAAVKADGTVLSPSFHRKWLFNPNNDFNDRTNPNWTNAQGKYLTLRPRPADHNGFPYPDDPFGDVKNLIWAPGGNDSIWIDLGAPVMTAPDGTLYKMLFAPLIMDLDGRINLNTAGNILGPNNSHVSNQGWGPWGVNLGKVLYADNGTTPTEWINLFLGKATGVGTQKVYGRYGVNGTPTSPGTNAPSGTPAHFYSQGDVNGLNENTPASASSRPVPPGIAPNNGNNPPSIFPLFQQGYFNGGPVPNGGTELTNHPLLYNVFRPPWYNGTDDRVFHAFDMEALLRPNMISNTSPVDTNSSAVLSDLIRLCPTNFGVNAPSTRFRNLVTTLSMDLGVPGVSPYWWNTMPAASYLAANPNNFQLAPFGAAVPFPSLPPNAAIGSAAGTNPPTSEFSTNAGNTDWRALSANTQSYLPTTNPSGYTTPGARIRLNRPLPPYPHMGSGVTPPYTSQPPNNTLSPYGVAYNLGNPQIASQYQAALSARQALANDIYRRLLAIAGLPVPANRAAPTYTDLAPRRWLAQLAVNIVDFIDEDDISTPFNFYTTSDGLAAGSIGATQGGDDPNATGANPLYWVFGTELPKVVLNEVLAEAKNPDSTAAGAAGESVKVWLELFNTMSTTAGTNNTQPQDGYRVPLYVSNPSGAGYSPYRITIAQTLMNQPPPTFTIPNPAPVGSPLPDTGANVLGKANIATPFPQSTTDVDFSAVVPLFGGGNQAAFTVPGSGNNINAGVDPQSFFLIGPRTVAAPYQDPFAAGAPGIPANTPVLKTDSVAYTPRWTGASTTDERTTGLTVMLRRLANPYLPLQTNPGLPNYNPYVTVDYIPYVPIRSNTPSPPPAPYASRGKMQPYAGLTLTQLTAGVPQANVLQPGTPVVDQTKNPTPPPAGAVTFNNAVNHTFGFANYQLPPSGHYSWLVHLDRPPISPMELLHVSAWPPYMLTQRFMLGSDTTSTNMFGHYAPWLDAPPAAIANMAGPWWFDTNLTAGQQSHRLYRLFEFFESGDWATGVNGLGRIPGKVNINTIWDAEILQALVDANPSIGINVNPPNNPTNSSDPVANIFANLLKSRSPNGMIGPVNMGTGNDDRPFLPLSAGLNSGGAGTQYPNGIGVMTDTLLRVNPTANTLLLFQNPADTSAVHPYLQTQLLTKLYNKVTTRSNTFAVFLTVGFFQVTDPTTTPPTLGAEIGRSEGRQIRHRMFAIVDRTNLSVFSTTATYSTATQPVPAPTVTNPTGNATIKLNNVPATTIQPGTQLVIEPGTANEETVVVQSVTGSNVTANFTKQHPNPAVTGIPITTPNQTFTVIQRGNPGPQQYYNPHLDPLVVPYFSIID